MTNRVVAQLWGRSEWTASTIIAWVVVGPNPVVILDFQMTGLGVRRGKANLGHLYP